MLKLSQKISNKATSESNYPRFKPERVKLCHIMLKIVSEKSCQIYARSGRNYVRKMIILELC